MKLTVGHLYPDLLNLYGGPDREQELACRQLQKIRRDFTGYVEEGALCWRSAAAISYWETFIKPA